MYAQAVGNWFGRASNFKGPANPYQADSDAPESDNQALSKLSEVDEKIQKIKAPTGQPDAPAMSCHDFKVHNVQEAKRDRKIWIDPNRGDESDKIQVVCEFRSKITWTCIHPAKYEFQTRRWVNAPLSSYKWFSDMQKEALNGQYSDDFEFAYDARRSQINSLAEVSSMARQDIVVNCNNTVAYYDSATQAYDQAVQLRAYDEKILTAGGKKRKKGTLKYDVDEREDGCMSGDVAGKSKIEIRTRKIRLLPIVDIAVRDAGDVNQEFGITLEPVCFGTNVENAASSKDDDAEEMEEEQM